MKASILLNLEVENEAEVLKMLQEIVDGDVRIIKGNAYDPGQEDVIPEEKFKFSANFIRHIGAVGGKDYGG